MKNSSRVTVGEMLKGPRRVRRVRTRRFMVSVIKATGGVIGVATYTVGEKRPSPSHHQTLPACLRDEWFSRLRFA